MARSFGINWSLCIRRRLDNMWARAKAVLLVLLTAWVLLPFSGFGGNVSQPAEAAPNNVYMLSFASPDAMRVLPALNIEILADYNNG